MTAPEQPGHSSATYTVFVTGELAEGADVSQVKAALAKLFKLAPERVDKVICGKPVAIRRGVDKAQAAKLVAALGKVGAMAAAKKSVAVGEKARGQQGQGKQVGKKPIPDKTITDKPLQAVAKRKATLAQAEASNSEPINSEPSSSEPGSPAPTNTASTATNPASTNPSITCPRCGHEQIFTTACDLCKMDLQLHIQRLARKEKIRAFQRQG